VISSAPLLTVRGLTKKHGPNMVIQDLSFSLAPGERLAVMGPSGCGKSTLLRLIAGLEQPTSGIVEMSPALRVGMVFQDLALWPNLSVLENVTLALPHHPRKLRKPEALAALEACHIAELARRRPSTLSIGQQQRVAIARAIAVQPHLLLLDEPFSSLDAKLKAELLNMVNSLAGRDVALILVTHDEMEAHQLCERRVSLERSV